MRQRRNSTVDYSWLDQFETEGPFLSLPVVKSAWPSGVDRLGDTGDRGVVFKQAYANWLRAYDARTPDNRGEYAEITRAWVDTVLDQLAEWDGLRVDGNRLPADLEIHSPGEQIRIRPDGALEGRDADYAVLLRIVEPRDDLRGPGLDGWSATEVDRMSELLRRADVEIGIVTDGRWWAIVWAHRDKPTGSAVTDATTWGEEPLVRDAFLTLVDQRRFRAKNVDERLPKLLANSEAAAEEITEALGTQVRKAVELLVSSFSRVRFAARSAGDPDPLPDDDDEVYQAAVTIMMRVVFLLFAEERGMLPTERLYWESYAMRDVLDDLVKRAAHGEELLDETYDTWHRLLAVSDALHGGVNYDEMRMPAYGGSLLDPGRFPWLSATEDKGLRVKVRDRVMLHVLRSVQYANIGKEARRISFRDIDVEQIGYIYEGLLGYTCQTVKGETVVGLNGRDDEEPEIDVGTLQELSDVSSDGKTFADALRAWVKEHQPSATPATVAKIAKAYDSGTSDEERAEVTRQLTPIVDDNKGLLAVLIDWSPLIRRDLRGIPFVVPANGLIVTETPSRKNAGAHYTPRSLAEEVVQHALEPLVYEPGPLQENDRDQWQLKGSTAILDLKVADIAAGSGAFLVAAARFLAKRVVEAWTAEDAISADEIVKPDLAYERAIREIVARCLYGADINPMAVEMCKLSLWLVSLDPTKPFSFVDDKIFCGNSLLGLTTAAQLEHLHIDPEQKRKFVVPYIDVRAKLRAATQLREQLASPVDPNDPMRSQAGKSRLLRQSQTATAVLRKMADGVIAAGLRLGGKPSPALNDAYKVLEGACAEAFATTGGSDAKLERIISDGLTPTVETDYERWRPLHWVLEAPDVMLDRGGFDAVIGNPPFRGGKKISGDSGSNVREFLVHTLADERAGECDLVGYVFLRVDQVARSAACIGLVASESLSEGETRRVALGPMLAGGWTVFASQKRRKWPTDASVHISLVWATRRALDDGVLCRCDGDKVVRINESLEPVSRAYGSPYRLGENEPLGFMGSILSGKGFVLDNEQRKALTDGEPAAGDVIRPLVSGDINSLAVPKASAYVIDFADRRLAEIESKYPFALGRVRTLVKPKRDKVKKRQYRDRWWQFAERGAGLHRGLQTVESVLAIVLTSDTLMPIRIDSDAVFTNSLGVVLLEDLASLAVLSSACHQSWAMRWGSSLDGASRYTTSDVFETFPRPDSTGELELAGQLLSSERGEVMARLNLGLTRLYNLVNDRGVQGDADVDRLREVHAEVDEATMEAYGWRDLALDHGFHTYRQMERWTVSPAARVEILDRLLELNHERARAEGQDVPDQGELF